MALDHLRLLRLVGVRLHISRLLVGLLELLPHKVGLDVAFVDRERQHRLDPLRGILQLLYLADAKVFCPGDEAGEGLQNNWTLICLEDQLAFFDFGRVDFEELDSFQDGRFDRRQGPPAGPRERWQRSIPVAVSGDLRVRVVFPVDGGS